MKPYYQDDWVTILHGKQENLLPAVPEVDLVITDPPYGTTSNKWDIPFDLTLWWAHIDQTCLHGPVIITASQPFTSKVVLSNILNFKHEWIWIKNRGSNFANTVREPMKEHESVLVFAQEKWTYHKQMQERTGAGLDRVKYNVAFESKSENYRDFKGRKENKLPDMRVPSSWQKFNTEVGLHPTQKPLALMEYLIKTYSNPDDFILDSFMGSGTVLLAARNLGRKAVGIEMEEKYCEIAARRMRQEVLI